MDTRRIKRVLINILNYATIEDSRSLIQRTLSSSRLKEYPMLPLTEVALMIPDSPLRGDVGQLRANLPCQ